MRAFKDMPIKHQLTVIIFVISFVSLWIACTAFVVYDRSAYKKNMVHEFTVLARIVASRSATAVAYKDPYQVRQNLDSLGANASVISSCITDEYGDVVAMYSRQHAQPIEQTGQELEGVECLSNQPFISRFTSQHLDLLQPVMWEESQKIGELHIRVDLGVLNKRFKVFSVVMLMILLLASFIAVILSSKIQAIISVPLLSLIDMADKITTNKDYSIRTQLDREDEIGRLVNAFNTMLDTIEEQNRALLEAKENLQDEVEARTAELKNINRELEAFTYSVSHDLRSPLRSIDGFGAALLEDCGEQLDETGKDYLGRMRSASQRMGKLIDSLLYLSRVSRQEVHFRAVDLVEIGNEVVDGLHEQYSEKKYEFVCPKNLVCFGDRALLFIALQNLISNAWKYSANTIQPRVELGMVERNGEQVFFVRDNGVGFDMKYVDKLFAPFQRLHGPDDFEGLGIGLATVARIVHRHGGEIWAEGIPGSGAVFYFTLGMYKTDDEREQV